MSWVQTAKTWFVRIATNWYVLGLIGWLIVAASYPIDAVLPRYAG